MVVVYVIGSASADKCFFTINKVSFNYTAVPQNINTSVTCLNIAQNKIVVLDNVSFPLYKEIYKITLDWNPLVEIKVGTFDKNLYLEIFQCNGCQITSFPPDFGPATVSLTSLRLKLGLVNVDVLRQLDLHRFPKLKVVEIMGIKTSDLQTVYLPPTITYLDIEHMKLTVFPNLTSARFPKLAYLRANNNNFQAVPNPFSNMNRKMWRIDINGANMRSADGVETLPNLAGLFITGNHLETVPDLIGSRKLWLLRIADNSRLICDYRMCWRRLWDRVRQPLRDQDDVTCVKPKFLAGNTISLVNPKFMQCENGKVIESYYTGVLLRLFVQYSNGNHTICLNFASDFTLLEVYKVLLLQFVQYSNVNHTICLNLASDFTLSENQET